MAVDQDSSGTVTEQNPNAQVPQSTGNAIADGLANIGKIPEDISEHAKGVLKDMTPEDIAKFAPYVKQWDQGVTKRFEEINKQYAPFKSLNVDEVQAALEINKLIQTDPKRAVEFLQSQYGVAPEPEAPSVEEQTEQELYDSLPKIIKDKLDASDEMKAVLEVLAKERADKISAEQNTADLQAYEELMTALEKQHGPFNKAIVTASIAGGMHPDTAVTTYLESVNAGIEAALGEHNNAPRTLSGKSVIPTESPDVRKMASKDVTKLVSEMLRKANQS